MRHSSVHLLVNLNNVKNVFSLLMKSGDTMSASSNQRGNMMTELMRDNGASIKCQELDVS